MYSQQITETLWKMLWLHIETGKTVTMIMSRIELFSVDIDIICDIIEYTTLSHVHKYK